MNNLKTYMASSVVYFCILVHRIWYICIILVYLSFLRVVLDVVPRCGQPRSTSRSTARKRSVPRRSRRRRCLAVIREVQPDHGWHSLLSRAGRCSRSLSSIGSPQNSQQTGSRAVSSDAVIGSHPLENRTTAATRLRTPQLIVSSRGGVRIGILTLTRSRVFLLRV